MSTKKPLNIAHRGGAGLRPENTLAAFAHALDIGVDGFELDVQLAKDGTVVVFHDDALKREIVRNAEENRLQILFDEIPDADTRDALKSNGFRWSPRNKAWQRQLTQNAEYAARRVLGL